MEKEKRNTAPIRTIKLSEKPIKARAMEKEINETRRGRRLSKRETSHPEMGRPIRELTGITSNRFPSSASFRSKRVFKVGIREAQVEKPNPEIKK